MLKGNLDIELYDLDSDIAEENDVASSNPELVEKINLILSEQHTPSDIDRFKFEVLGD